MQAVVLAAGKGYRLRPLTETIPKCMVEIAGKTVLERILENLESIGITEVLLVVGHKKETIEEKFKEKFNSMNLKYFVQEKQLGTAHALSLVEDFVKEPFIALNGDTLVDSQLFKDLAKTDEFDSSDAKLAMIKVSDPWRYGCLKLEENKVKDIVEKPAPGKEPSNNANIGVYWFDKLIFAAIKEISLSERNEFELVDAIKKLIYSGGQVIAIQYNGRYAHITDKNDISNAEKNFNF